MKTPTKRHGLAIWTLTQTAADLGRRLQQMLPDASLYFQQRDPSADAPAPGMHPYTALKPAVHKAFHQYTGHIFIMATGIVVRIIAPMFIRKTTDPAVLVMDEAGAHVISLLSGHLGGANALTRQVAGMIGATPVITTASDISGAPALDLLAAAADLYVETPSLLKRLQMCLLDNTPCFLYDPYDFLAADLPMAERVTDTAGRLPATPGIWISHTEPPDHPELLVLRPQVLFAGIGCNRGTPAQEILDHLVHTFSSTGQSIRSLSAIGTLDIKADEAGLTVAAETLHLPLIYFDREALGRVDTVPTPSSVVHHHIGVHSVCEAAAILTSRNGELIVPKTKTRNVTLAIARTALPSSASAPVISSI
ncbi:MAG: cobalamin biosynthesis protein CbiG [Deltaproteobacteria bacterium]|nr:MAG: cobalamin biosynthesis protein CbiG [Deltaproteobacteria bacterium]